MLKKLVFAAVAAGALVAVRKRAGGKAEADLLARGHPGASGGQHPDRSLSPTKTHPSGT